MSNLIDYLVWRGDLPICAGTPLCAVDSMILARCSYLRYDLVNPPKRCRFSEALESLCALSDDAFFNEGDPLLVKTLLKSARFRDLVFSDYRVCRDPDRVEQFAACAFHLPENELYLSFIGTDNTLIGLREDFNMAFLPSVPSQEDGLNYTREMLKQYPDAQLRLGGHSKGGSVALYIAHHLTEDERARLISADNFDGPGFDETLSPLDAPEDLTKKLKSYLPKESIIGRMMTHREPVRIVESTEKGIGQHSLFSWEVLGSTLVSAESFESSSDMTHKALSDLLDRCTPEQRKTFFDSLYGMIASTDANADGTLEKGWYKKLPEMISTYRDIPEEDRKTALSVLSELQKSYFSAIKTETVQQFQKTKDAMRELSGRKTEN